MIEWFKKNIWNIISVIGTIATLIFGVYGIFFVPDYVKNAYKERQSIANFEIVNDLKEIIYSNQKYDSVLIPTLKKGKELKYDIIFTKTNNDIIVAVQEDFMSDKFLPLDERIKLYSKADSLKLKSTSDNIHVSMADSKSIIFTTLTYFLSFLSLIISGLLMFGLFTKRKLEISQELENKFMEIQESHPEIRNEYKNFEKSVGYVLNELNLEFEDFCENPKNSAFDYLVKIGKKKIGLEVKSRLRTDVLIKLTDQFKNSGLDTLIIVTNGIVDFSTYSMLINLQKKTRQKFYFVSAKNKMELKNELSEVFRKEKE